jgi:hypothetical protein
VAQKVILDQLELFCNFLHCCCCGVDAGTGAQGTTAWSSALTTLSISVLSEARTRPLPACVFTLLVLRPGLRRLTVRSEVTTAAVQQAAASGQSTADAHEATSPIGQVIACLRAM